MRPRIRSLDQKMLRELWRLRGQLVSIALVVATAVMTLVTMRGTYETLERGRADYYRDYRMADVWATLERAPESLKAQIEAIPGVAAVETRVSSYANLDLPWLDTPGQGLFLSLPEHRRASVNDAHVRDGRYLRPGRANDVLVSELFFDANDLRLGDTIRAVLNGVRREMVIVGSAIAPDQSYSAPPGALYPDDERFGVFWASRNVLGPNLDADEAFNEVALRLSPHASEVEVIRELDRLLDPYGGMGGYGRADHISYKILNDELNQNRTMGTAFPIVFLGVAAFLLSLVLGRLIATQRTEIGALKAMGYTNREVGLHFLSYSLAAVGIGTLLGAGGGVWAGDAMVGLYEEYFRFPTLEYELSMRLVFLGGGISLVAAVVGGWRAVLRAASLPPAEAMRPEPPERFTPGWLERTGVADHLSTKVRFILRNLERRPLRAALSSLGIAFSVSILVIGMFMFDGIARMMDVQFELAQQEDVTISFTRDVSDRVQTDLRRVDGVTRVELLRFVPVRLHSGQREREVAISGIWPDTRLRRIVDEDGRIHAVPLEGIVLSAMLADRLRLERSDTVRVEALAGRRRTEQFVVADVVRDLMGISAYMHMHTLERLTGDADLASAALLSTDPLRHAAATRVLDEAPGIASLTTPASMIDSFESQLEDSLYIAIMFIVGFASIISVAVIYNGSRIALSERGRELASLRVLGFTRREVATLLFGEQAVITLMAIPAGWAIGYGLAGLIVDAMASETYRIPLVVSSRTYAWSAVVTLVASAASAYLVRRRLHRMDLIAVLKTRE